MGTFARGHFHAGEVVTVWRHGVFSAADAAGLEGGERFERSDGMVVWLPPGDEGLDEDRLNHSCDPNVWMEDEVTLSARRSMAPGEELTGDYSLWELDADWVCPWRCECGAAECRGVVTGRDWELPELQARYGEHFHPVLLGRMGRRSGR
ncbi:MAG: SET domain-containing protein-lysine N-methyltransferase [Actinomycetota bacterium]